MRWCVLFGVGALCVTTAGFAAPPYDEKTTTPDAVAVIEKPRITVRHTDLPTANAESIAKIAETTYDLFKSTYSLDLPDRLFIEVSLDSGNLLGIWIENDQTIRLTYRSRRELLPPRRSDVDTIYGLTYRIADLARARTLGPADWLTDDAARGLSHYLACAAIDRLHLVHGLRLWPDEYSYVETGWRQLREQIDRRNAPPIILGAAQWHALTRSFGNDALGRTLTAWKRIGPAPRDPDQALLGALTAGRDSSHERGKYRRWFRGFAPVGIWTTATRRRHERGINSGRLARDARVLQYDDDSADSAQVLPKGAHITTFQTPPDQWYLSEIQFHGERYGDVPRGGMDFVITIRDEKIRTVASWRKPYGLLRSGGPRWHRVSVPVTRLPDRFVVSIEFASRDRVGVRLSADASAGGHSASGGMKSGVTPLTDSDWMIRTKIDRLKDDNPLTYLPDS